MSRKPLTKKEREQVYRKYLGHCAYCGAEILYKEMQVDHFAPVHVFGDNTDMHNLMPACRQCNFYKSTYTISRFREQLNQIVTRLERDSFIYRLAKKYDLVEEHNNPVEFYYEKIDGFITRTRCQGMSDWNNKDHEIWDQLYSKYGVEFVKWYREKIEIL